MSWLGYAPIACLILLVIFWLWDFYIMEMVRWDRLSDEEKEESMRHDY